MSNERDRINESERRHMEILAALADVTEAMRSVAAATWTLAVRCPLPDPHIPMPRSKVEPWLRPSTEAPADPDTLEEGSHARIVFEAVPRDGSAALADIFERLASTAIPPATIHATLSYLVNRRKMLKRVAHGTYARAGVPDGV